MTMHLQDDTTLAPEGATAVVQGRVATATAGNLVLFAHAVARERKGHDHPNEADQVDCAVAVDKR